MPTALLIAVAIRWMGFLGLATLVGSLVVETLVLPGAGLEAAGARRRLRRLRVICLTVLIVTTAGELVTRAATMAGGDLAAALPAIPAVLARTHFGAIWIGRFLALIGGFLVAGGDSRPAQGAALLLALAVTLTTSLTGHAADWGDLTWSAGIDWVHVVAVSAWAGGLISLAVAVLGEARRWPGAMLGAVMGRFSWLAGFCLLAVLVSGSYNTWAQLSRVSALWDTGYGRVLAVKLVLVLGLIWWGAVNRYTLLPRLGRHGGAGAGERLFRLARLIVRGSSRVPRHAIPARLGAYVRREAVLVVLVLGATAVLVDSTPARHAEHAHLPAAPELAATLEVAPVVVTMEELHGSGGIPKGWIFTPPPGDAAEGRAVFVRLGCHACHIIRGEAFPASSGLGPDLTGVGGHHPPGYILESILNPNAVIVKGRGYTDAEGRSIMPDYRGRLSVSELIDLVSYLESR